MRCMELKICMSDKHHRCYTPTKFCQNPRDDPKFLVDLTWNDPSINKTHSAGHCCQHCVSAGVLSSAGHCKVLIIIIIIIIIPQTSTYLEEQASPLEIHKGNF